LHQRDRGVFNAQVRRGEVTLTGVIDENADLSFLERLPAGKVTVNLRGVRRINSYGVRIWLENIRRVPEAVQLQFVELPPPIVDQANMLHGFLGRGRVMSFLVPYVCERCRQYREELLTSEECRGRSSLPVVACPSCSGAMEVDDVEEQYLQISREA
jgi:hypothetical protein